VPLGEDSLCASYQFDMSPQDQGPLYTILLWSTMVGDSEYCSSRLVFSLDMQPRIIATIVPP
jgi:hypothetical protein